MTRERPDHDRPGDRPGDRGEDEQKETREQPRRAAPVSEILSDRVIDAMVQRRTREMRGDEPPALPPLDPIDVARLAGGEHDHPHGILGAHPAAGGSSAGIVVRAFHPDATRVQCLLAGGAAVEMERSAAGMFQVLLPGATFPLRYRLRFQFADGSEWERGDPYAFQPTIGEVDLHLFNEGTHRRLWDKLGAHPRTVDGVRGVAFAVWAPNARRVSVIGDFCGWDGRLFPMRQLGSSGVHELFVPDIGEHTLYKYELLTREGVPRVKTDPFAFKLQQAPDNASIVVESRYAWSDEEWMERRATTDWPREAVSIYEVHLGSWARVAGEDDRPLSFVEIAPRLAEHAKRLGFTHVELLPVAEHPFTGSWGYQVSGYFAPTSRHGSPDDFRFFVDTLHQHGIGVIMDWVPAHFPKDDWALRRFDGTALYEHEDPRLGEHPDWGTLIFNYGRNEVRNFLVANALYWLDEYHVDGLRVDAVASMLYLDYSRPAGQWLRNRYGGRENLEAIEFLRQMTETVRTECPGAITVAEESTAWPGVTKPVSEGGLGFTFKWNMGWMHDTLSYFEKDPIYRRHHHDQLTFAMMYEHSERFIMPLSHDEVVHLKRSMLDKMPGDVWQKFANLRLLYAYQFTRPGKQLMFMGGELGTWREWDHDTGLEWQLKDQPLHGGLHFFVQELGRVYREHSALWRHDHDPEGFQWIDVHDRDNSVLSYMRRDGDRHVVVVLNMTPIPRDEYRIGAPELTSYEQVLSTDDVRFGGSGYHTHERVQAEPSPFHGFPQSMRVRIPPLGAIVLAPSDAR
ncbi:MAG TPA: 1,4-alpha-glucan branching protein GlgB [Gemmatimonadaceae bacterium]|nr:1,4-alpha-glucan branching protein GlgB [Gemmatimonadaceae bacterium]